MVTGENPYVLSPPLTIDNYVPICLPIFHVIFSLLGWKYFCKNFRFADDVIVMVTEENPYALSPPLAGDLIVIRLGSRVRFHRQTLFTSHALSLVLTG